MPGRRQEPGPAPAGGGLPLPLLATLAEEEGRAAWSVHPRRVRAWAAVCPVRQAPTPTHQGGLPIATNLRRPMVGFQVLAAEAPTGRPKYKAEDYPARPKSAVAHKAHPKFVAAARLEV